MKLNDLPEFKNMFKDINPSNYLRNFNKKFDGLIFKTTVDNAKFRIKAFN